MWSGEGEKKEKAFFCYVLNVFLYVLNSFKRFILNTCFLCIKNNENSKIRFKQKKHVFFQPCRRGGFMECSIDEVESTICLTHCDLNVSFPVEGLMNLDSQV